MSRIGIEPEALRDALLHDRQQLSHPLFWVRRIDEVEVAALDRGEIGHQALVDAMRVGDDPALGGLAENLGQAHHRHGTRGDDVGQHLPRPDRRQLIDIADEQQRRLVRQGAQQSPHQRHVDHRRLVDDEQIAVERRLLGAPKSRRSWGRFRAGDGSSSPRARCCRTGVWRRGRSAHRARL